MKPIVGILAEVNEEKTAVLHTYIRAIEESGGIPVLIPYIEREETFDRFLTFCDGFFFTGGADIDPGRYGEKSHPESGPFQPLRDVLEFSMLEKVYASEKPILGVCRGAQLLNVFLGGALYQHIPDVFASSVFHRQSEPKTSPSHSILICEHTPLRELVGKDDMLGNSFHHQAVKTLGKGLRVMAKASDGIVEAFYSESYPYLRAYQWHPERLFAIDADNKKIFEDFISATESRKTHEK